ncbi:hypothetical protein BD770DRAFT_428894 [Pilaira anomala]|nr:hypothetical protein BD770DRAFT_428894 [Pilaira anomala]
MAGSVAMTGVAMTGVAMTDVALTNTGVALVAVVMMFLTISNSHFRKIAIRSLLALESKRTKRLLNLILGVMAHKTIRISKEELEIHVSLLMSELLAARVVLLWDGVSKCNGFVKAMSKFCEFYFLARRVGLMVFILVVISKKNIIIDCCVVVLIRCILVLGTSASGPPRGLSWKTEFGNFEFGNFEFENFEFGNFEFGNFFSPGCKG